MIVAFDPGRNIGVAFVTEAGALAWRAIVDSEALRELGIAPETVLVIKGNRLLTRDAWIDGDDVVEVRPVMSGGC